MKWIFSAAMAVAALASQTAGRAGPSAQTGTAFDFEFTAIDGAPLPLAQFRGRPMLIVNTASFCGYTGQYDGLQKLWETYGPRGLAVIGVPSNDFHQETKSQGEIAGFCKRAFGVTFPLTMKYRVKGDDAHPLYSWANGIAGRAGEVKWNFHKYLFSAEGRLAAWFPTRMQPLNEPMTRAIEAEIASIRSQSTA